MIQAHADAFLGLLRADADLTVHDGKVPEDATGKSDPPPYVLVYFADSDPESTSSTPLTGESKRHVTWAYCHCVGGNQIAARAVAQRVRAALLDVKPTITGRTCWPIRREEGQPTERDETTGTPLFDLVTVYRLESVTA